MIRRREDGYHEVDMIMQSLALHDTVTLENAEAGIYLETDSPALPCDERNLAYRAAERLLFAAGKKDAGIRIRIEKRIPMAAGLAGGSADCAAVLTGANEVLRLGFSREKLMEIGAGLGADVPYCILKGTARARGIGEKLQPIAKMPPLPVLLVKPGIDVSTKTVYQSLTLSEETRHPKIDALEEAIGSGELDRMIPYMENLLETVTIPMHPVIRERKAEMKKAGAAMSLMSGSGPTVFGLFESEEAAEEAEKVMRKAHPGDQVCLTRMQ